jgi:hypothetical protein
MNRSRHIRANIPGAVPRTATVALTNATIPYVEALAKKGWRKGVLDDPGLAKGINVLESQVTYEGVAQAHGLDTTLWKKFSKDPQKDSSTLLLRTFTHTRQDAIIKIPENLMDYTYLDIAK